MVSKWDHNSGHLQSQLIVQGGPGCWMLDAAGCRLEAAGCRLEARGCRPEAGGFKLEAGAAPTGLWPVCGPHRVRGGVFALSSLLLAPVYLD